MGKAKGKKALLGKAVRYRRPIAYEPNKTENSIGRIIATKPNILIRSFIDGRLDYIKAQYIWIVKETDNKIITKRWKIYIDDEDFLHRLDGPAYLYDKHLGFSRKEPEERFFLHGFEYKNKAELLEAALESEDDSETMDAIYSLGKDNVSGS